MDNTTAANDSKELSPFQLIPKECTALETNSDTTENIFRDVNIVNKAIQESESNISFKVHNVIVNDPMLECLLNGEVDNEVTIDYSQSGETTQNIQVNDPMLECLLYGEVDNEVTIDTSYSPPKPYQIKYRCDKCKQIFDQLSEYNEHMVTKHKLVVFYQNSKRKVKYWCRECRKTLKNKKKFEAHIEGHGNPDFECNICFKVYASKASLRLHRKNHSSKYVCHVCKVRCKPWTH